MTRRHGWWLLALAVFAAVCGLRAGGVLRPYENLLADARAKLLEHEVRSDIVIVEIDAASLATLDRWPWPRRLHADLLKRLAESKPRSVFLDIDFSSASNALDDAVLEGALTHPRDFPVYLPTYFQYGGGGDDTLVVNEPLPRFGRQVQLAVVNHVPGADGLTRQWRNAWHMNGARAESVIDLRRSLPDGTDVVIDYSISPASFTTVRFADVLDGRVPREVFAGKTVFVGATSVDLNDMVAVPVYLSQPGIVVQALATETVNAGAPVVPPEWVSMSLLALVALLMGALYRDRWRTNLLTFALSVVAVLGLWSYAFVAHRLWLDAASLLLTSALMFVAVALRALESQTWKALTFSLGMRRREALLQSVVQSSTDSIICVDEAGIIRTANPAAARLFDCPAYELVDQNISRFITLLAGEGAGARLGALHGTIRECDARTVDGDVFPVEISVSRVRNISSGSLGLDGDRLYTAIVRDIRERRAQQRKLQHQATHDSLTNLPNRAALLVHLDDALAAQPLPPHVALLLLDLSRFKEVNDTLGHEVGDRVLTEVAQRFQAALGAGGFISRIGGDEFTVVLDTAAGLENIDRTAQALGDCLRTPIDVAGISIEVGVSIGIARFPQDASDAQSLMRHADVAMYVAKRRGASYEYYDPAHDENTVRRLSLGGELRAAIAGGALDLHFQPQVNLRSGMVESAEALVRWHHPTQGSVSPGEFIAIAESTDLIRPLTEWTLSGALTQIRAWRDRGVHVRIAVNISARILQDTGFPARLAALLETAGVPAASLELEITESAMMVDPTRALRVLQGIDSLGVLVSIDDFGTGYSSLGYLRDLPVHSLKLDKSFVMGMRNNTDDRIIVESTAQMAHALRLELVAEGVESEWEAQFLAAAGYDFAQGFHFARAMPADKCLAWIVEFNATAMLTAGNVEVTRVLVPDREPGASKRTARSSRRQA
ncbi:MAG TPA: EAL domain-containing protein [Steroidobacteraceae bacterium]|nr:EAL domain-containing protein [Steroidobacteraceae bacterium]